MEKLRSVQVLRAVAAIGVLLLHSTISGENDPASGPARIGGAGVDLFFVISGFIIASIAPGREPARFLASRSWRIYPLWLIAVLPWLFMRPQSLQTWVSSLTLWPIFDWYTKPALELGWTLSFEMLFYLAAATALRFGIGVPVAVFSACFAVNVVTDLPLFDFLGSPMIFEFLMGALIARLPRRPDLAPMLIGLAFVLLLFANPDFHKGAWALGEYDRAGARAVCWGIPAAFIVYGCLSSEHWFQSKAFDWPVRFGDASYSIYLFHPLALLLVSGPWYVEALIALAFSYAVHALIERRLGRKPKLWTTRLKSVQSQPA